MSDADRERWDARHGVVTSDVAMPPGVLRGREDLLPQRGRALDVACGRGAVAVWLAERGFAVDAVDVSGRALAAGSALAARSAVADRVRFWDHDLDSGLPDGCAGPYDVIVCQRFRDPALYPAFVRLLGAGGVLAVTVLSEVGEDPGPFRAPADELLEAFGALTVLVHEQADGEERIVAAARAH